MDNVMIGCGCANCGAAEHEVSVDYFRTEDGVDNLDVVLTCVECDYVTNGFIDLDKMIICGKKGG